MIHNTHFAQYIPPGNMHYVIGTWADAAGQVAGTICKHKTAAAETATVTIPIEIPSNSVALNGCKLASIEIDYEILILACTSVTATVKKITRGLDTSVDVVATVTSTQDLVAAVAAATVDQHKLTVTITTPAWIDNDEIYIVQVAFVAAATSTIDVLAAVANYTFRA
jgi:hypothetical protein